MLLILAVVSIGAVRNSGIIGHATNTSDSWKKAQAKENTYLEGYEEKLLESTGVKVKYTGEGVPVPLGFKVVEGDKDSGLVISDGTNEFVWIPVTSEITSYGLNSSDYREPDVVTGVAPSSSTDSASGTSYDAVESNLKKAGFTADLNNDGTVDAYDFKIQLEKEFNAMAESVNYYGGFYVGRYEVSNNGGKAQSVKGATSANASDTTSETWYGLYNLCKQYDSSSVTSSMIWSSQWEAIMNFIGEDNKNKTEGRNTTRETGSVETDKIKNIYDLIGNSWEWTLTARSTGNRVVRGGHCDDSGSPSGRDSNYPTHSGYCSGSRLTLYVEL